MSTKTIDPATATRDELVNFLKAQDAYSGHSRDSIDQLRSLVTDIVAPPDAVEEPAPDLADMPQDELAEKAKAEWKAVRQVRKAGDPEPPATPHLDELNRRHEAGEKKPRRNGKAKREPEQPAPTPGRGYTVVELKNAGHGEALAGAVEQVPGEDTQVDGKYLVVKNTDAQALADELVSATDGAGQFVKRQLTMAHLLVRHAYPKVTDDRGVLVARLVTALHDQDQDWSVSWAADMTPRFTVEGTVEDATARDTAAALGVPSKAS